MLRVSSFLNYSMVRSGFESFEFRSLKLGLFTTTYQLITNFSEPLSLHLQNGDNWIFLLASVIKLEWSVQMHLENCQVLNKCKYILGNIFWNHWKTLQKEYFSSTTLVGKFGLNMYFPNFILFYVFKSPGRSTGYSSSFYSICSVLIQTLWHVLCSFHLSHLVTDLGAF